MILQLKGHDFAYEIESVVRLFYPRAIIDVQNNDGDNVNDKWDIKSEVSQISDVLAISASVKLNNFTDEKEASIPLSSSEDEIEQVLGKLLFEILVKETGQRPPWGILTGVRPVRLYRNLLTQGFTELNATEILQKNYLVSQEKIDLAKNIAAVQAPFLDNRSCKDYSLYISIPFCPSRCLYCSFISHDIDGMKKLVPQYIHKLCEEIDYTAQLASELGLVLKTIYIGGGTPTTLSSTQLEVILKALKQNFDCANVLELTVEAGRPDTITRDKLEILRKYDVGRISINPQVMDDSILRKIGRDHTVSQVIESYKLAREIGFSSINMDLIAGLPGDTIAGFDHTIKELLELAPENITVHTLTVKRSSRLRTEEPDSLLRYCDAAPLIDNAKNALTAKEYHPYYLYRQKGTLQNLENIGYSRAGHEGMYNILAMEDQHTIFAVGAGATTKVFYPNERLQRFFNFKFPLEYIRNFDEVLNRKKQAMNILKELLKL